MIKFKLKNRILACVVASFALFFGSVALTPHLPGAQNLNFCYAHKGETLSELAIFVVNETNNEPLMCLLLFPDENQQETKVISFNPQNLVIRTKGETKILNKTFCKDGADASLAIVNEIFKTNIKKPVTFKTSQLTAIIDSFGGWETEITKEDALKTNENLQCNIGAFKDCPQIEIFNENSKKIKLNGAQLLAYSAVNPEIFANIFEKIKSVIYKLIANSIDLNIPFSIDELMNFGKQILFTKPIS